MELQKNIEWTLWNSGDHRIHSVTSDQGHNTRMPTTHASTTFLSLQRQLQLLFLETRALLLAFLGFLFIPAEEVRKTHGVLLRSLFVTYLLPAFIVLGPHAIFLMVLYQIGFNMLLRAALHI